MNEENKTKVIDYVQVKDTPFTVAITEEGARILLGNNLVINEVFEDAEQAEKYINEKPWTLITGLCGILSEEIYRFISATETHKENKEEKD